MAENKEKAVEVDPSTASYRKQRSDDFLSQSANTLNKANEWYGSSGKEPKGMYLIRFYTFEELEKEKAEAVKKLKVNAKVIEEEKVEPKETKKEKK
jgi:hypothetical protein